MEKTWKLLLVLGLLCVSCDDNATLEELSMDTGARDTQAPDTSSGDMTRADVCEPVGVACLIGSTCCSGQCEAGCDGALRCVELCPTCALDCVGLGEACTLDKHCCGEQLCEEGRCVQGAGDGDGIVCMIDGESCDEGRICCSGNCGADGFCGSSGPPCFQDGEGCTDSGMCCTGTCNSEGVCGAEPCEVVSGPCVMSTECCSGLCDLQLGTCAWDCLSDGNACDAHTDCCSERCTDGVCREACSAEGEACAHLPFDCCEGFCDGITGTCAMCKVNGNACSSDVECCTGVCGLDGLCGDESACSADPDCESQDCCAGFCNPLACCMPTDSPCETVDDCCALYCDPLTDRCSMCLSVGNSCTTDDACCSGNCEGGTCLGACSGEGDACGLDFEPCCDSLLCDSVTSRCGACLIVGNVCEQDSACCTGYCHPEQGFCDVPPQDPICSAVGGPCFTTRDCALGGHCVEGMCEAL